MTYAEAGIPVGFMAMPTLGSTAPATTGGALVVGNAELVSAIVLMQLVAPGAPVFYSLCASVMDPQTAGYIVGISEKYLCNTAGIQFAHDWGVPVLAGAFAMDSPEPDTWKLGRDSVYTSLLAAMTGADLAEGLGMIKSSTLLVPEQIIFDDEIYHTHRALVEGVDTSVDGLAMDTIKNVGPGGHFLGQKHTRKHLREIWIPELSYPRMSRGKQPSPDIRQRAREKFDKILKEHQPEPLEEAIQRELEKILRCSHKRNRKARNMKYFSRSHNRSRNLRPPDLYEYFVDNFWFKSVDLENQKINEPLRGSHKADVVVVGGGFTGLSAAYHIRQKFPEKKIVLLEGACCGYGASGRNGGFCIATDLLGEAGNVNSEVRQKNVEVSLYGLKFH